MFRRIPSYKNILLSFLQAIAILCFSSCALFTVVKNEPKNEPFIFETKIKVEGKEISKEEKVKLEAGLYQQLDDSIAARKLDKVLWKVLKTPTVLDTSLISKSIQYMGYYLNSEGYFGDSIQYTTKVKDKDNSQRAYINFYVWPGKVTRIDSLSYTLMNDSLQAITDNSLDNALIKEGSPFAQNPISAEMDRLVELFRNNGYLLFNRNHIYGLWDTLDINLLKPTLDPFEQAEQLEKLQARKLNPTANLDIRTRPLKDSSPLTKYYVGNVTVYPDGKNTVSESNNIKTTINNITIIQNDNKFKSSIFPPNIYLKRGELYKQSRYLRTVNRFNSLPSWRLVDIKQIAREKDQGDTVDFEMSLTPAPKYSFSTNLEGSLSQGTISGRFFGWGINLGLQNRNFLRAANLMSTNLRYGIELGSLRRGQFIQTRQISLSNSIAFPRFIIPGMYYLKNNFRGYIQSVLSLNAANTERRYLFNLTSFNTSWGYEFTWRAKPEIYDQNNKTYNLRIKLPNIEYSYIKRLDSLNKLIEQNPSIRNLFSDGLISSVISNFSMPWSTAKSSNAVRLNLEASGLISGLIRNKFLDDQLYQFIKFDAEYAKLIKITPKSSLVLRGFGGIGYELESTRNPDKRTQLPFFKQYFSGGPNSMRAWQLRRLGPGSTIKYFENDLGIDNEIIVPDRFGDVQLEANIEYRLPLLNMAGIPVNGAIFTDVGNVWLLKKTAGLPEERFNLSRLGTDLAIGSGVGVRVDFSFFVIRLDYAYKVKDPSPSPANIDYRNKFFAYPFFKGSQLQVGIGYPFIF